MSLCITVPPETKVGGEIGKMEIGAARYIKKDGKSTKTNYYDQL